jgi:hypothetical protein
MLRRGWGRGCCLQGGGLEELKVGRRGGIRFEGWEEGKRCTCLEIMEAY